MLNSLLLHMHSKFDCRLFRRRRSLAGSLLPSRWGHLLAAKLGHSFGSFQRHDDSRAAQIHFLSSFDSGNFTITVASRPVSSWSAPHRSFVSITLWALIKQFLNSIETSFWVYQLMEPKAPCLQQRVHLVLTALVDRSQVVSRSSIAASAPSSWDSLRPYASTSFRPCRLSAAYCHAQPSSPCYLRSVSDSLEPISSLDLIAPRSFGLEIIACSGTMWSAFSLTRSPEQSPLAARPCFQLIVDGAWLVAQFFVEGSALSHLRCLRQFLLIWVLCDLCFCQSSTSNCRGSLSSMQFLAWNQLKRCPRRVRRLFLLISMAKVWDSSISVSFWSLSRYSHIIYFVPCAPPGAVYLDCASLHYFVILDSSFLVLQEIRSCCA